MLSIISTTYDTVGYVNFAEIILQGTEWLRTADVFACVDVTLLRLPLYPLIIALCKKISPDFWQYLAVLIQLLALIYSGICLFQLAHLIQISKLKLKCLMIIYFTGQPICYAFTILTDSLFLSLSLISISKIAIYLMDSNKPRKFLVVPFISLLLIGFMRESAIFFILSISPILILTYPQIKKKALTCILICLASVLIPREILKSWNFYRTGERVISSGLASALSYPMGRLIEIRKPKETHIEYFGVGTLQNNHGVFSHHYGNRIDIIDNSYEKKSIIQMQEFNTASYYKSIVEYYDCYVFYAIQEIKQSEVFCVAYNPIQSLRFFFNQSSGKELRKFISMFSKKILMTDSSLMQESREIFDIPESPNASLYSHKIEKIDDNNKKGSIDLITLINFVTHSFFKIISVLINIFAVIKSISILMRKKKNMHEMVLTGLFLQSILWIGIHTISHLEYRYVLSSITIFNLFALMPTKLIKENGL